MLVTCLMLFVLSLPGIVHTVCATSQKTFVVQQKSSDKKIAKLSKNALKEHLGESTRDAFHVSTELGKQMGVCQVELAQLHDSKLWETKKSGNVQTNVVIASNKIHKNAGYFQIELSTLQKRFSQVIEQLVDNQPPFKKAGRGALQSAYKLMMETEQDLKKLVTSCSSLTKQLKQPVAGDTLALMKSMSTSLQAQVDALKKVHTNFNAHECLKTT